MYIFKGDIVQFCLTSGECNLEDNEISYTFGLSNKHIDIDDSFIIGVNGVHIHRDCERFNIVHSKETRDRDNIVLNLSCLEEYLNRPKSKFVKYLESDSEDW